jgi:MSHA biogenesis protein MshP
MKPVRGFSLPSAIFLLVILSLLGAFMLSLSTTQSITSAQDVQGSRAYRAARAGLEWAVASICYGSGVANPDYPASTSCPTVASTTCPTPPAPFSVDGFAIQVSCSIPAHDEGGTSRYVFFVESTATAGGAVGSLGYVERRVSTFVEF